MSQEKFPPRVKLRLRPGRVAKWYPEVAWCEEEFTMDMVRHLPGEEIAYVPEAALAEERAKGARELAGWLEDSMLLSEAAEESMWAKVHELDAGSVGASGSKE